MGVGIHEEEKRNISCPCRILNSRPSTKPCHDTKKKTRKLQNACVSLQHANLNFGTFNMANMQLKLHGINNRRLFFNGHVL